MNPPAPVTRTRVALDGSCIVRVLLMFSDSHYGRFLVSAGSSDDRPKCSENDYDVHPR